MDVSIVLIYNSDSIPFHPALASIGEAYNHVTSAGVLTELIIILDKTNSELLTFIESSPPLAKFDKTAKIFKVELGDEGLSRNFAVEQAEGKYICFVDGDSIIQHDWIEKAFNAAQLIKEDFVLHTEYSVFVDNNSSLIWKKSSSLESFVHTYIEYTPFDAPYFTTKKLLVKLPYLSKRFSSDFDLQDWHWHCSAFSRGVQLLIVPKTIQFFGNKRPNAIFSASIKKQIIYQNEMFSPVLYRNLTENEIRIQNAITWKIELEKNKNKSKTIIGRTKRFVKKVFKFIIKKTISVLEKLSYLIFKNPEYVFSYRIDKFFWNQKEGLKELFLRMTNRTESHGNNRYTWFSKEFKKANKFNPTIKFDAFDFNKTGTFSLPKNSELGLSYFELCKLYEGYIDHLIFVGDTQSEEVNLLLSNIINSLVELRSSLKILIIQTEGVFNEAIRKEFPRTVNIIDGSQKFGHLSIEKQQLLYTRAILQFNVRNVHIHYSLTALNTIQQYGNLIQEKTDLYVHFCPDLQSNNWENILMDRTSDIYKYITNILVGNSDTINHIKNFDEVAGNKFRILYQNKNSTTISNFGKRAPEKTINNKAVLSENIESIFKPGQTRTSFYSHPLISVILPVFNAEKYIKESIESILGQSYGNFELLVFNDGSHDNSLMIINGIKDPRIKVINRTTNKGLIFNLNDGIKVASGKYIARMDADDIALPERFEKQVSFLENNPEVGICGTWFRMFNESETVNVIQHPSDHEDISLCLLFKYNAIGHPTVMIRREEFRAKNLLYNEDYLGAEDYKIWTEASQKIKISNLQEVQLLYRWHPTNISSKNVELQRSLSFKTRKEFLERVVVRRMLNENEVDLLTQLFGYQEKINKEDLESFALYLIKRNKEENYFDAKKFNNYISLLLNT